MSKGSNTTTTSQTPTALPAYQGAISQLQQVAQNPYNPYTGELVSPVNQQQQAGIGNINNYATAGVPYLQTAAGLQEGAANPLTQQQIQQYQSPYTQDVVNATEAQFNNQNAIQQQQVLGNAAAQGALGGDRTAVAQSVLAGQQSAQEAPVIAGLENQGYTQALQTAGQQFQQNPEQAAYGIASTGQGLENAALTGANAQVGAGTLEQQTQQAQDTAAYQQFMQQQFMPESMLSWELPLLTGVGSQEGGTSQTTAPAPNQAAQYAGLGLAALGMFANRGGRVQGLQSGGVPGGFTPGVLPGNPWLPSSQMPRGPGAPVAPKVPGQVVQTPQQMADQATKLAKGIQGAGPGLNNLFGQSATYGGGDILSGDVSGGSASSPLQGLDASDYGAGSGSFVSGGEGLFSYRGGRIQLKRGGVPVRAGLGMASFMPRRKFADGGADDSGDDVVNFPSDRFVQPSVPAGLYNNSSGEANPLENILKFQTYGLNSPYVPQHTASNSVSGSVPDQGDDDSLPPQITGGPAQQAGIGTSAMSFANDGSRNAPPVAPPDSVNAAPAQAPQSAADAEHSGLHFGFGLMSPDAKSALLAAGLGMMASRSPFLGTAIGEGGMQGLQTYGGLKKQEQDVDLKVKQLDQAAKAEQDRISLEAKKQNFTETQMTPYEKANLGMAQQRLDQENWAPFTDPLGNPKLFNKKTGEVRDPLTANLPGTPATPGATPGTAPPSALGVPTSQAQPGATPASASTTLPPTVDPKTGIDAKTGRNEAYLQTLNPQYQDLVKKIANYDIDPRAVGYRQKTALQAMIARYDPAYRDDIYPNIKATELAYNKGKQGDQIQFYNNSLGHMNTLLSYADAMNNGNIQVVNSLKNAVSTAFGQPAPNTFNGIKDLVAAEIMKSVVPGGGGVTEREELAKKVSAATSPQQITDLMNAYKELGGRQLYDLKLRYQAGTYGHRDDFDTRLSPEGLAEMKRVEKTEQYKGAPAAPTDPTQRHANTVYMTPKGPMMYTTRGTWTEPQI